MMKNVHEENTLRNKTQQPPAISVFYGVVDMGTVCDIRFISCSTWWVIQFGTLVLGVRGTILKCGYG